MRRKFSDYTGLRVFGLSSEAGVSAVRYQSAPFGHVVVIPVRMKVVKRQDPIKEIAKIMKVESSSANELLNDLENEIDQICKEEKVEELNSEEKEQLVLGMLRAVSSLSKRLAKQVK